MSSFGLGGAGRRVQGGHGRQLLYGRAETHSWVCGLGKLRALSFDSFWVSPVGKEAIRGCFCFCAAEMPIHSRPPDDQLAHLLGGRCSPKAKREFGLSKWKAF